ncbi:MAG: transposase [Solirubrobacteraceae bacterium]
MAGGKRLAAARGAWICFQDEAGQTRRPPRARTWARRGHPAVVRVSAKGSGRVSIAGLVCLRPGHRGRLMFRTRVHRGRPGERRSFSEQDYIALLDQAHQRLGAALIVVWDNLNTHVSARMRRLIEARRWLTVVRLPGYAPELNPVESLWAPLKRGLGNLAVRSLDQLAGTVRDRLRTIQRQPDLIAGFLAQTGMTLEPEPSWPP